MEVSLEKLLETGAHFGHQTKRWNPRMEEYVYGVKNGIYIFDLIKTKKAMEEALEAIKKAKKAKKNILLLGTKKQVKEKVKEIGKSSGISYVEERWLGGTLTNFDQIKKSVKTLKDLREDMAAGKYKDHTKKERLLLSRKIEKLERNIGGIEEMDVKPDLMIIVDTKREHSAVREAKIAGVKIAGIVDTNGDPNDSDYPIPMNDDSPQALEYIMELIADALGTKPVLKTKKIIKKSKK